MLTRSNTDKGVMSDLFDDELCHECTSKLCGACATRSRATKLSQRVWESYAEDAMLKSYSWPGNAPFNPYTHILAPLISLCSPD